MFDNDWDIILKEEINKKYFIDIINFIKKEYKKNNIYPDYNDIFKLFKEVSYKDIKVVILGQDPYHTKGVADGFAFSTKDNKIPPSLRNIYLELYQTIGIKRENSNLLDWVKQGVFLLNTVLTVEESKPLSHKNIGWEKFTDEIISLINQKNDSVAFVLLGKSAEEKEKLITNKKHTIIKTSHPSPFSAHRGFLGSNLFIKINDFLKKEDYNQIKW